MTMRDRETLLAMEDVTILLQYLYMDEDNTVEVENCIGVPLQISMSDKGNLCLKNLNFPEIPKHAEPMNIFTLLDVVDQLKDIPPKGTDGWHTGESVKTRWDEIKTLMSATMALNRK